MTVDLHPGTEADTADSPPLEGDLVLADDFGEWQSEFLEGTTGSCEPADDTGHGPGLALTVSGAGDALARPGTPNDIPGTARAVQVWVKVETPCEPDHIPELILQLASGTEISLGRLDFTGWHLLGRRLPQPASGAVAGLLLRGLLIKDTESILVAGLAFDTAVPGPLAVDAPPPVAALYGGELTMFPAPAEDVTNSIQKDGISFLLEARSLSAVIRYIYTPIEGNLSDIEVEINSAEPIKISEDGGVTVEMEGEEWSASDEQVERHFVSCEQIGQSVEARWRWKRGDELADFLYRISIRGKSLLVELEGGNGKATGVDLGYVSGAAHPRLIRVPYLNLGDALPRILCTSGIFVSSFIDWYDSDAAQLYGPSEDDELVRLNGGCRYAATSEGRRRMLRERWVLTVARSFDEVLPAVPLPVDLPPREALASRVWCQLPRLEPSAEAYVEAYEQLLSYRQLGMTDLLVLQSSDTWRDAEGPPGLALEGAQAKGGDDALTEYLEAVDDLGYPYALAVNYRDISPVDIPWRADHVAQDSEGNLAASAPGRHLLRPTRSRELAADHLASLAAKFGNAFALLGHHASKPPWERVDCDARLQDPASFGATLAAEQALLASLGSPSATDIEVPSEETAPPCVIGEGGSHWMYAGLLPAYLSRLRGVTPSRQPLLLDFALRTLHPVEIDAGVGSPSEFAGREIAEEDRHSRSPDMDRYLAATVAFGHAAVLPDLAEWGMPAVAKTYFMLRHLQTRYLGVTADTIHYHHDGNFLEITEALVSGAIDYSQVRVVYANGLHVYVNGGWSEDWSVDWDGTTYRLPPASFLAHAPDGLLVYSADAGSGRVDMAACGDYTYCDARGTSLDLGSVRLDGAAIVRQQNWEIDLFPLEGCQTIEVDPASFWPDRRMPPLRLLAYQHGDDDAQVLAGNVTDATVVVRPHEDYYRYSITLPEWMVEPGK
ncbi:hypothetical protein ACFL6X_00530 [Candidatus Latescibacterota bacterium]